MRACLSEALWAEGLHGEALWGLSVIASSAKAPWVYRARIGGKPPGLTGVTLESLPAESRTRQNPGMSDYRFNLTSDQARDELQQLVDRLRETVERAVSGYARVIRRPADTDDGNFSQELLVSSQAGQLEVAIDWNQGRPHADVSVATPTSRVLMWLPAILALLIGVYADHSPELLPVLRGVRVMLGAVSGLVVGVLLTAVLGALGVGRAKRDPELDARVQGAVRAVLQPKA